MDMNMQDKFCDFVEQNNVENVKLLLNNKHIDPTTHGNFAIQFASSKGYTEMVCLLLNDNRTDPSDNQNFSIRFAFENKHFDIVNLLWKDQRVKNTLKNHSLDLYNNLIKKDQIKEKVEEF